ncbi:MAG: hypothetical protein M0O99_02705 [Desulfuromonas thiophila]|jgi:hypothetical protein|nr:hypothetical protein [Desulfuromonas thiophila]
METRVQIAAHFTIDPAKQVIGSISWPKEVVLTLAVGDELVPKKVLFSEAFSAEQQAEIERLLNAKIIEAGRTAKPVASPAVAREQREDQSTETEMSLF